MKVENKTAETEDKVHSLSDNFNQLRDSLNQLSERFVYLSDRMEFIRLELMYEINKEKKEIEKTEPKILNPKKIEQFQALGRLYLNLGCGHKIEDNKINVDKRELPGVDIVADAANLPFEKNSVDMISSEHLLEHFTTDYVKRTLLPYWVSLLKHGGKLRIVVPDIQAMIEAYNQGKMDFHTLRTVIYGLQEYDGDFHYTMFSYEEFEKLFKENGLIHLEWKAKGRKNGLSLEMELVGEKI